MWAASTTPWYQIFLFSALMVLVGQQEGHLACKKTWVVGAGVVICLERGGDLHMAQLMPLLLTLSCFSKIQIGLPFWYRLTRVVSETGCVCVWFTIYFQVNNSQVSHWYSSSTYSKWELDTEQVLQSIYPSCHPINSVKAFTRNAHGIYECTHVFLL